jgi:hypothetical protein
MGTSNSFRSPQTPRWRIFNRALDVSLPLERVSVQLFLAGESEWRPALDNPALAAFAEALQDAHSGLSERLAVADQPAPVITAVVSQARQALFDEGFSVALPVAERALRAVLVQTLQGGRPLAEASGGQAAEEWERNRGTPGELIRRFLGEMFGQWAAHVAARDTARLVNLEGHDTETSRELSAGLSKYVREVAEGAIPAAHLATSDIGDAWQEIIAAVFEAGRKLEPIDGA